MQKLKLVSPNVQKTSSGNRLLDPVRQQLVPDGPEERVRQSVIQTLVREYGFPVGALASEELVARGTKERGRADVLVRLPRSAASNTFRIDTTRSTEPSPRETSYSEKVALVRERLGSDANDPALHIFELPDELTIEADGTPVVCRVLGFANFEGEGHCLILEPVRELEGLPPYLGILVCGWGQASEERALAHTLGLPELAWTERATQEFVDAFGNGEEEVEKRVFLERSALSADGRTGSMLFDGAETDSFAVLVRVDLDAGGEDGDAAAERRAPKESARGGGLEAGEPLGGDLVTVAVIECKAPSITLTANVNEQANRYASRLGAWFVVVTNGVESRVWRRGREGQLTEIEDLPTYAAMLDEAERAVTAVEPEDPPPRLPANAGRRPHCVRFHRRFRANVVGSATPQSMWLPILALDDALRGTARLEGVIPFERYGVKFLDDLGLNVREPGSVIGAGWPGVYRDFLVEAAGRRSVLGLSLQGGWEAVDPARALGRIHRSGWTYLLVATSEGADYESTLQCAFDKSLRESGRPGEWRLAHDGRLTAGKGAVRRDVLFEAIESRLPTLLRDGRVDLGALPIPSIDADSLREFLARVAVYASVRRQVKRRVKAQRKRRVTGRVRPR